MLDFSPWASSAKEVTTRHLANEDDARTLNTVHTQRREDEKYNVAL